METSSIKVQVGNLYRDRFNNLYVVVEEDYIYDGVELVDTIYTSVDINHTKVNRVYGDGVSKLSRFDKSFVEDLGSWKEYKEKNK